jgi:hypothetical protein
MGDVLFLIAWTSVGIWGCAVTRYRWRHPADLEASRGLLAWGARSSRFRGKSAEQIRRASKFEFWFWLAISLVGEVGIVLGLLVR